MSAKNLLLSLLLPLSLCAAERIPNLDEALQRADRDNPGIQALQEGSSASTYRKGAAFRALLPKFTAELTGRESTQVGSDDYTATLAVNQPIYQGGRLWKGWKIAELTEEQSLLQLRRQRQFIRMAVKQAWVRHVAANDLAVEAQSSLERLTLLATHADKFFNEGLVWSSDVLEAEVNVAQGQQGTFSATRNIYQSMAQLNSLLSRPLDSPFAVSTPLQLDPVPWTRSEAFDRALQERPDLKTSELETRKRQHRVSVARSGYHPSITGKAEWSSAGAGFSRKNAVEGALFEIDITQNVWDWGKVGREISAAEADQRQSTYLLEQVTNQVLLEVESAYLSVEEARQRAEVLERALSKGQENYDVNTTRYKEQIGTARDVLEAQDLLTRTRKDYINAVSGYQIALATLEFAMGVGL